ncbi:hypothetical protein ASG90_20310 [Nocardioides sp. Soil797]|nr:hypothetical protein ASG90_20310 [Nocardioides sp. Soil797]
MRRLVAAAGIVAVLAMSSACNDSDDGPGVTTDDAAAPLKFEIRPVLATTTMSQSPSSDDLGAVLRQDRADDEGGDEMLELGRVALTGADVESAEATQPPNSTGWAVVVDFTDDGDAKFAKLTEKAACETGDANRIAIIVDDEIISSPSVSVTCGQSLTSGTQISGDFTKDEAEDLAERINDGQ